MKFTPSDLENIAPGDQGYDSKYVPEANLAISYVNSK